MSKKKPNWNIMKQTLDLDEVMSVLGIHIISKSADEITARCPLPSHTGADTNPSFAINENKLAYNCFVCGGGSVANLVMETQGLEWEEALAWLLPYVAAATREDPTAFSLAIKRKLYFDEEQSEFTMPYFKDSILKPWLDGPFDYYVDRGIPEHWCRVFKLGFDSNYTKYNPKTKEEWHGQAAIIPHFFEGNLVGYQARIVGDKPQGMPRFDNTSNFPKADTLYGYDYACANYLTAGLCQPVYVCESALTADYIVSLEQGPVAVSTFGATVSKEQIHLLRRFPLLVLAFDNDTAGRHATVSVMEALKRHTQVRVMNPVDVEKGDLLDLPREQARKHMRLTFPASLYDYYLG